VHGDLALVRTLGGVAPMEFEFYNGSGYMAFTDGCGGVSTANRRLLLVTDGGHDAVHVIDVVHGTHVGYVAAPGTIMSPCGVAARKSLAAVSCCETVSERVVRVFEGGSGSGTWTAVRTIAVGAAGLRFTADGLGLVVAENYDSCVSMYCAKDGSLLRHLAFMPEVHPVDVEELEGDGGMRAGWVVCGWKGLVAFSGTNEKAKRRDLGFNCSTLATAPGLGLLVVRCETGVQFFATPDAVAMAGMSSCKVAWMVATQSN